MRGITESLAGRVAIVDLLGLSRAESEGRADSSRPFVPTPEWIARARLAATPATDGLMEIYSRIWLGAFPRLNEQGPAARNLFYRSYIQTYIQRDVQDMLKVTDQTTFNRFLGAVAARTGQLLNYASLAREVEIDNKTVKSWMSILEASGLVYLLQPYHRNLTKRLVKTPKLDFRYRAGRLFDQMAGCCLVAGGQHVRGDARNMAVCRNPEKLLAQWPGGQRLFLPGC